MQLKQRWGIGIAAKRSFVQNQPEMTKAFMVALTDGAKIYKEDGRGGR